MKREAESERKAALSVESQTGLVLCSLVLRTRRGNRSRKSRDELSWFTEIECQITERSKCGLC